MRDGGRRRPTRHAICLALPIARLFRRRPELRDLLAHGHPRRLDAQHQRTRARAGAARADDGVRRRDAADAGAAGERHVRRPALAGKRISATQLAVFASRAFGVPLIDLSAFDIDQIHKDLIDLKIAQTRHVLPLHKRGNRLYVATSDPANLQALEEVRFKTNLVVEPVVVEDDKLAQAIHKLVEASGATLKDSPSMEDLEIDLQDGASPALTDEENSEVEDAPVVKYLQKILIDAINPGVSDIHFEPYEKYLPGPLPARRHPDGGRAAAARDQGQARVADQGDLEARHLGEARAAGRPDEDRAVEVEGDRLPREHAADALRREDRDAYPRLVGRQARHRGAGLRARPAGAADVRDRPPVRDDPRHRPDRQRQDRVALHLPQHPEPAGRQHLDGRGPGGNPARRRQPGQHQREGGAHVRGRAAGRSCARIRTSSWSAKSATSRPPRSRSRRRRRATSCCRRCTPTTRRRR